MSQQQKSKRIIIKNISVIAPSISRQKDFELHQNSLLEIITSRYYNDNNEIDEDFGIRMATANQEPAQNKLENGLGKVDETVVSLENDLWVALPAFTDLCWDTKGLSMQNIQNSVKEKWSQGIGLTVALLSGLSAENQKEIGVMNSIIPFNNDANSDLQRYHNSSNLISLDIQDGMYTLSNSFLERRASISPFPAKAAKENIYYGSGNHADQSISPWMFALMKGPQEDFKEVLYNLTLLPNELLQTSHPFKLNPKHVSLPNIMILKVDSRWNRSSLGISINQLILYSH